MGIVDGRGDDSRGAADRGPADPIRPFDEHAQSARRGASRRAPKKKPPVNLGEAHRRDPRWGARGSGRPACAGGTQAQGGKRICGRRRRRVESASLFPDDDLTSLHARYQAWSPWRFLKLDPESPNHGRQKRARQSHRANALCAIRNLRGFRYMVRGTAAANSGAGCWCLRGEPRPEAPRTTRSPERERERALDWRGSASRMARLGQPGPSPLAIAPSPIASRDQPSREQRASESRSARERSYRATRTIARSSTARSSTRGPRRPLRSRCTCAARQCPQEHAVMRHCPALHAPSVRWRTAHVAPAHDKHAFSRARASARNPQVAGRCSLKNPSNLALGPANPAAAGRPRPPRARAPSERSGRACRRQKGKNRGEWNHPYRRRR
jgi:hypothetical protein